VRHLLLVLPITLVVGCGGGGTSATGVTKAAYLKQAEAICAKAVVDRKALKPPTSITELSPYVTKVVALADTTTKAIGALEPPKADKADLQAKVLAPLNTRLVEAHAYAAKVATAQKKNDQLALVTLLGSPPTVPKEALTWMRSFGFVECVKAADTSG
jgi:hypothetical protein